MDERGVCIMNETLSARDYSYEIQSLKDLITIIQSNVNFTLSIFLGVLGIAIAITGVALAILARKWVNDRFDVEIKSFDNKMKEFLIDNPPMLWARGVGVLTSSISIGDVSPAYKHEYQIKGMKDFSQDDIIYIDAYYIQNGVKIAIDEINIYVTESGINVYVIENIGLNNPGIEVRAFLLWSNPKLKNNYSMKERP